MKHNMETRHTFSWLVTVDCTGNRGGNASKTVRPCRTDISPDCVSRVGNVTATHTDVTSLTVRLHLEPSRGEVFNM